MVKVKMTTGMAGKGYTLKAGEVVSLPAPKAEAYVKAKYAEYVEETPKPKTRAKRARKATRKPTEER